MVELVLQGKEHVNEGNGITSLRCLRCSLCFVYVVCSMNLFELLTSAPDRLVTFFLLFSYGNSCLFLCELMGKSSISPIKNNSEAVQIAAPIQRAA